MTSTRPYLLRAMYDWILDNGMTPHILVNSEYDQVVVPRKYEQDGKIVLNISPTATDNFDISNQVLTFDARFDGNAMNVYLPVQSILAIYTRENGRGMMFEDEDDLTPPDPDGTPSGSDGDKQSPSKPHLTVVK